MSRLLRTRLRKIDLARCCAPESRDEDRRGNPPQSLGDAGIDDVEQLGRFWLEGRVDDQLSNRALSQQCHSWRRRPPGCASLPPATIGPTFRRASEWGVSSPADAP